MNLYIFMFKKKWRFILQIFKNLNINGRIGLIHRILENIDDEILEKINNEQSNIIKSLKLSSKKVSSGKNYKEYNEFCILYGKLANSKKPWEDVCRFS